MIRPWAKKAPPSAATDDGAEFGKTKTRTTAMKPGHGSHSQWCIVCRQCQEKRLLCIDMAMARQRSCLVPKLPFRAGRAANDDKRFSSNQGPGVPRQRHRRREVCLKHRNIRREILRVRAATKVVCWQRCLFFFPPRPSEAGVSPLRVLTHVTSRSGKHFHN